MQRLFPAAKQQSEPENGLLLNNLKVSKDRTLANIAAAYLNECLCPN